MDKHSTTQQNSLKKKPKHFCIDEFPHVSDVTLEEPGATASIEFNLFV